MKALLIDRPFARCFIAAMALFATPLVCHADSARQPERANQPRPNVLFIAIDDLKPLLGCYGNANAVTPSMDRLAAEGTVFLNAHCQFPVCGGSRASLMTSLRPESSGVMDLKTSMRAKNPKVVTLPQYFKRNGYATTGVGKIYDPRCVDDRKTNDAPSWSIPFSQLPYSKLKFSNVKEVVLAPEVDGAELTDGFIASKGVELLRKLCRKKDKPFFLAVGFKKPHLPFVAPKKYWNLYQEDKIQLAKHPGGIENASGYTIHNSNEFRGYDGVPKSGGIPESLQRKSIHGYLACVSFIDAQVGLLLDELESLGLEDNTIVVLWGDHGFHLGDHGMWGKHSTLENAARVPLIIRTPVGKSVATSTAPAELVDIFPTLCELADLAVPNAIDGRSLVPVMNESAKQVRDGALTVFKSKGSIGYSYRTDRYRYTEWVNKTYKTVARELYDYETDPLEKLNLADQPQQAELQAMLAKQLRDHSQGCERMIGASVPVPTGKRLRDISKADGSFPLLIGAASNAKFWGTESSVILEREFAYVTPGNDFKQTTIHPEPGTWNWDIADAWVKRCKQNGQVMRLHSAISPQCSHWAKDDSRTAAELKQNLEEYVTEVCKRYHSQPHIRWMDVVNETVSRNGEWFGPREGNDRWENPWYQIGVDETHPLKPPVYIKTAFELANRHAPNIKQIVNQHGGMEKEMWEKVQGMIVYLQDQGVRVDGLGWQAHIDTGFEQDPENVRMLKSLIEWAQSRNLEFHVTECNVWIRKDKNETIELSDLEAQAQTYREIVRILGEYSDKGVVTWCAWQIRDNETERGQLKGCLFGEDAVPKPAYYAIQSFLAGSPAVLAPQKTKPGKRTTKTKAATIAELLPQAASSFQAGKYEQAFKKATRICKLDPDNIRAQLLLGEISFAAGKMNACVAAYDEAIRIEPTIEPRLWQRGLALYYADRFEDGVKQFETHQTVNSQDVENAVWHLLCAARIADVDKARKKLIPISGDTRVPMSQIYEMFAGRMTPEDVLKTAQQTSARVKAGSDQQKLQLYYAHLYTGLYHEMLKKPEAAMESLKLAEETNPLGKTNFMGQVARVHLNLRETTPGKK